MNHESLDLSKTRYLQQDWGLGHKLCLQILLNLDYEESLILILQTVKFLKFDLSWSKIELASQWSQSTQLKSKVVWITNQIEFWIINIAKM